jgi:hypothetical protein
MAIFLRAKHWQLFLLVFAIPIVLEIFFMVDMFGNMVGNHNPASLFSVFKFFPVIMLFFICTLFGWFWAVGVGLQKLIPAVIKMNVTLFKVFFFIPSIYMLIISFGMSFMFWNGLPGNVAGQNDAVPLAIGFAVIFPIHFFSMFCIFYCLYFVAKTIKTAELQRGVTFSDFAGEFFLSWFFFIGVWILQPRINKLIEAHSGTGGSTLNSTASADTGLALTTATPSVPLVAGARNKNMI